MINSIDYKARIFQRAMAELGVKGDAELFIKRVKELDKGLASEDEFLFLLNWTGRCSLFNKLEQSIVPLESKEKYTIPDILSVFEVEGRKQPYLIEIKASKKNSLSWTEKYYQGLINYSALIGIPILIAWKWTQFETWLLFDIKHFSKGPSNYKIGYEKAYQESMMSKLVGDYFVVPYDEFGLYFKFRKVSKAKEEARTETWNMIIEDIYFVGKNGQRVNGLDPSMVALLLSFETDQETTVNDKYVLTKYYPSPNKSTFAQSIPIRLARAMSVNETNWIERIKTNSYPVSYSKLYKALDEGINKGLIRNILHIKPLSEGK